MSSGTFGRTGAALLLSALAACSGIQAAPKPPLANFEASLVQLQEAYSAGDVVNCLAQPLASQAAVVCRDRIVQALMITIDLRYEEFEIGFFDANRYAGFGGTLATLGLTTAGAVVSGGTSQLLSTAAAGVTGAREAFKREVLAEQTSVALLTAMRTQRDQVGLRIRLGLRRNATEYPLGVALADVSAYYRAGTIVGALTGVTEAVGVEREKAQENLQQSIVDPKFAPPVRIFEVGPAPAPAPLPQTDRPSTPRQQPSKRAEQCPLTEERPTLTPCIPPLSRDQSIRRNALFANVRNVSDLRRLAALASTLGVSTRKPDNAACVRQDIEAHILTLCTSPKLEEVERALSALPR